MVIKTYEEALARAIKIYQGKYTPEKAAIIAETLISVFPELKESDDEKMLREIKMYIKEQGDKPTGLPNGTAAVADMLAWLEKQSSNVDNANKEYWRGYREGKQEILDKYSEQHKEDYQIRKDIATFIFNYRGDIKDRAKWMNYLGIKVSFVEQQLEHPLGKTALEAIKEEKVDNANKIEPKFKNGEWIVWQDKYYKVNYNGCGYELVDQNGLITPCDYGTIDKNAHLWNLCQDAKDGDVLARNGSIFGDFIFIYDHTSILQAYGYYSSSINKFILEDREHQHPWERQKVVPATKEQCDLLFVKIKDAGYKWNAEKKELIKLDVPNNIWHSADEEPVHNAFVFAEWEGPKKGELINDLLHYSSYQDGFYRDKFFISKNKIRRWAYVEDLTK